jgi:rare lipoprotein A
MRLTLRGVGIILVAASVLTVHADGDAESNPRLPTTARPAELNSPGKFTQIGRATYYHKSLRGMKTAQGERYDPNAMTAAHRRLKLGTYVRVTNLRNKRSVMVRVNDRLPPRSRASIDLSTAAARQLGILRVGVAKVKIEALSEAQVQELANSH